MIVITLSKVPLSLRGDLTKWCQEIQTGVYVGNFSARIRDLLWERIQQNLKNGEATLIYSTNNELGYTFRTTRKDKQIVEFDGLPLMKHLISTTHTAQREVEISHGWSNAAKFHQAKLSRKKIKSNQFSNRQASLKNVVCIDTETTGLDPKNDELIEIAAVRRNEEEKIEIFHHYIKINAPLSSKISQLTGITDKELSELGLELKEVLIKLKKFIGNDTVIGYNLRFDLEFLRFSFMKINKEMFTNSTKDLLKLVKRKNKFMSSYKLHFALERYGIINEHPHTAHGDAIATFLLGEKLYKEGIFKL